MNIQRNLLKAFHSFGIAPHCNLKQGIEVQRMRMFGGNLPASSAKVNMADQQCRAMRQPTTRNIATTIFVSRAALPELVDRQNADGNIERQIKPLLRPQARRPVPLDVAQAGASAR